MICILSISGAGGGGPFGDVPVNTDSIGVGFSDGLLLVVSVIGFVFLAVTVYSIVILRLQTSEDFQKHQEEETLNYEERLARADVATLTRAQRRARARTIMKQKRRITPAAAQHAPPAAGGAEDEDEGQDGHALLLHDVPQNEEQEDHHPGDDEDDNDNDHVLQHNYQHNNVVASRKERQKIAKAVEAKERRLYVQERRQQQEYAQQVAQYEKKERERLHVMKIKEERRLRQEQDAMEERQRLEVWNTFLSSPNKKRKTLSVKEWIIELKKQRIVNIDQLAVSFALSTKHVTNRIHELIQQRRIAGVVITTTTTTSAINTTISEFVYFSEQELQSLVIEIEKRGSISPTEMANLCNNILCRG
jgi:DDRGK domain